MMSRCIFCDIIARVAKADILYEDASVVVFRDIAKRAPFHVLVVPKEHLDNVDLPNDEQVRLAGHMVAVAGNIARREGYEGYKLVWNIGSEVGQVVPHGHLHVLAGKRMTDL